MYKLGAVGTPQVVSFVGSVDIASSLIIFLIRFWPARVSVAFATKKILSSPIWYALRAL